MIDPITMPDGIIELDSTRGEPFGFTSDDYNGYLWKKGDAIYISFIISRASGNFQRLLARILEAGLTPKVPTPLGRMRSILVKHGWKLTKEPFGLDPEELVDVWISPSTPKQTVKL